MMKKYIKPNTDVTVVELQPMMEVSGPQTKDPSEKVSDPIDILGKEYDFFTAEETAEKNEYPVYSLWED